MNPSLKALPRLSAGLLLLGLVWAAYTQDKPQKLAVQPVKKDLYEIAGDGSESDAGNVAVYVTGDGVILVDDRFDYDHDNVLRIVKSITSQPIKYVLNTHYHSDHSGGNGKMFPMGVNIISTAQSRKNILEHKQPNALGVAPANLVFTDQQSVFLGGKEVRAKFFGRGHTNGDAVIYFPDLKVIHTGDLMADNSPLIDYGGGGSIVEWTKTLDRVAQEWDFDAVIPGHGAITDKAGLRTYRDNIVKMRTEVSGMVKGGKSQTEVAKFMEVKYKWALNGIQQQWSVPGFMTELK
jgi:glyoxylase-like metal-dependent hydrolase (beta-lactamase superfamily II)